MTVLSYHANADHGLHGVEDCDCELRVHIRKSDEDCGYYLLGLAVETTIDAGPEDAWYAFNDLIALPDAFEIVGAQVPDCAWFSGGRWIFTELPDAIHAAKQFAESFGVCETIESHNAPLRQSMKDKGYEWKSLGHAEHFVGPKGYEPDPVGHIRGPHHVHGNVQYSVQGPKGWLIRSFRDRAEGEHWALEMAAKVLAPADEAHVPAPNETLTLTMTEEDAGELYYAFRQRGESSTRTKVAEFLRQIEAKHGRQLKGEWFDAE